MNFKSTIAASLLIFSLNNVGYSAESLKDYSANEVYSLDAIKSSNGTEVIVSLYPTGGQRADSIEVKIVIDPVCIYRSYRPALKKLSFLSSGLYNLFGDAIFNGEHKWSDDFITIFRYSLENQIMWYQELGNMVFKGLKMKDIAATIREHSTMEPALLQHELFKLMPKDAVDAIISASNKKPFDGKYSL